MQNEYEIKKEMCEIGKRVYMRGMVAMNSFAPPPVYPRDL